MQQNTQGIPSELERHPQLQKEDLKTPLSGHLEDGKGRHICCK